MAVYNSTFQGLNEKLVSRAKQ